MIKKIKDLTYSEVDIVCEEHCECSSLCPLFLSSKHCYCALIGTKSVKSLPKKLQMKTITIGEN